MPNKARTVHWGTKARASGELRRTTYYCARNNRTAFEAMLSGPVVVSVVITWEKGRRIVDQDAAVVACKPILDGLTEAGVWLDDKQVQQITVRQEKDPAGIGSTVVAIREAA